MTSLHLGADAAGRTQKDFQTIIRRRTLEYIQFLVDNCEFHIYGVGIPILEAHQQAMKLLIEKGGVQNGFVIGHADWDFPVGSLEFEWRDRGLMDCMTGLFSVATFRTGLAVHTLYAMDTFPLKRMLLVGMPGEPQWSRPPDRSDYHSNNLLTCLVSY